MFKKLFLSAAFAVGIAGTANAAGISQFNRTTNDGWFSITQAQADFFGASDATGIAFFRIREGNGTVFNDGDTFDQSTILNSFTSGSSNILGIVNGTNADLTYTGGTFDALGTTTVGASNSYFRGVGLLMSATGGNAVARGSSTFNVTAASTNQGALDFEVSAVPLPAAAWMLLAGIGGIFAMGRRRAA